MTKPLPKHGPRRGVKWTKRPECKPFEHDFPAPFYDATGYAKSSCRKCGAIRELREDPAVLALARQNAQAVQSTELLADRMWRVGCEDLDSDVHSLLRQGAQALRYAGVTDEYDPCYRDCCETGACLDD